MPDPTKYKNEKTWMQDCMHQTMHIEKKDKDQAVAMCINIWKKRKKRRMAKRIVLATLGTAGEIRWVKPNFSLKACKYFKSSCTKEKRASGSCDVCGRTMEKEDWFMINDSVFKDATEGISDAMKGDFLICFNDLRNLVREKLKRELNKSDFSQYKDLPLNTKNPEVIKITGQEIDRKPQ